MGDVRAVVITGIGVVSPVGIGRHAFWADLIAGRSGIGPIAGFSVAPGHPNLGAEVRGFAPRDFISPAHLRRMDKLSRLIVAASRLAIDDSGVRLDSVSPERIGVVVGTALGNISESVGYLGRVLTSGPSMASPLLFPNLVMNAPASYVAMELGAAGTNFTVSQGETSGEQAIILGAELIRSGRADVAVVGGGDELAAVTHDIHRRARTLSPRGRGLAWSSPYDAHRNGLVLGEGAAMLVLESATRAAERSAKAYASIEGAAQFAVVTPPYDWPRIARSALTPLRRLLADGRQPDLICGAANSSRRLDACELDLYGRLMGESASGVWLTSLKGSIGEFGGAGAFGVAAACLALDTGTVPPLCHLRDPGPSVPFRFARPRSVRQSLTRALVCGIARGGSGAALSLVKAGG